jgi:hypothetical protein
MRQISERKMGAELLRVYEASPQKFVDIVNGNNPKAVEKIFGPGNFDIAEQMSPSGMKMLRESAALVTANKAVAEQVPLGAAGLSDIRSKMMRTWQIPNQLNPTVTLANKVLNVVSGRLNEKVMQRLIAASQDGRTLQQLLDTVPAVDRNALLRALNDKTLMRSEAWQRLGTIGTRMNALAPESTNELAAQP